jgi:hypothetical protein
MNVGKRRRKKERKKMDPVALSLKRTFSASPFGTEAFHFEPRHPS